MESALHKLNDVGKIYNETKGVNIMKREFAVKRYIKTYVCVFLVLLFITLSACNRGEMQTGDVPPDYVANVKGHITVSYPLATDEESKLSLRYFAQSFMNKYSEATVSLDFSMGNTDARIASGDIGDVFFIWEEDTYTYGVENKVLMPIDAYLEVLDIDISNVYAGVYDLGTADGRLYMAARDFTQHVIIYNTTALDEQGLATPPADWTWEQFKEYCRKLTKEDADGTLTQIGASWNGAYPPILISFLEGWGGKWYDTVNKRVNFVSDDKVLRGFSEQIEAMEEGILKPTGISGSRAEKFSRLSFENSIFRSNVFPALHSAGLQYESANTARSVAEIFNVLRSKLTDSEFSKLFPVILTDRGFEFIDPTTIEINRETGEAQSRVFYCDPMNSNQKAKANGIMSFSVAF